MKEFKEQILRCLNAKAKYLTVIYFAPEMRAAGTNKLSSQESLEIAARFIKGNPGYKLYRDVSISEPLFNQLLFSESEYDGIEEIERWN